MNAFKLSFVRRFFIGLLVAASFLSAGIAQAQTRPFKATLSIIETVSPPSGQPPCGSALKGEITGSGTSTLTGSVAAVSTDCIIPLSASATGAEFAAISNSLVLTAANGDQLFASYIASFSVTFTGLPGADGVPGIGVINGNFVITGGSGSLAGVIGGGTMRGTELLNIDPATGAGRGQGSVELTGAIRR